MAETEIFMKKTLVDAQTSGKFNFPKDILYPACAIFSSVMLALFLVAFALGFNVTETRDRYTQTFGEEATQIRKPWLVGDNFALETPMLIGLFLFCISMCVLTYILKDGYSKSMRRLVHYFGSVIAFFIFVLGISGYISNPETNFAMVMVAVLLMSVLYFLALLFRVILTRPVTALKNKFGGVIYRYIAPAVAIFAISILVTALLGHIFKVEVEINYKKNFDVENPRIGIETWETLITPLAHTLQNLFRYLGSAALFMLGLAVYDTKINKVAKGLLNFLICTLGFILLWVVQMPFFHELDNALLISIVVFLAVYIVAFTSASIVSLIIKRKREEKEEYEQQFSVKRSKK